LPTASGSRTLGFALLGGFIGALVLGLIATMMPINGVPFFVAAVMMMGIMGSTATAAGWMMHLITGLIIGAIFGALVYKVRQLRANTIGRGLGLGAVSGIVVWIVFFIPMANALASSMGMSLMGMGATMIGGSFLGHLIFGLVLGGVTAAGVPKAAASFKCPTCGASFGSKEELMQHGKVHMSSKPAQEYKCQACGATFSTQQELMEHNKKAHPM
jgi:NADH:quinone reductase (non-electrogenic)